MASERSVSAPRARRVDVRVEVRVPVRRRVAVDEGVRVLVRMRLAAGRVRVLVRVLGGVRVVERVVVRRRRGRRRGGVVVAAGVYGVGVVCGVYLRAHGV